MVVQDQNQALSMGTNAAMIQWEKHLSRKLKDQGVHCVFEKERGILGLVSVGRSRHAVGLTFFFLKGH